MGGDLREAGSRHKLTSLGWAESCLGGAQPDLSLKDEPEAA